MAELEKAKLDGKKCKGKAEEFNEDGQRNWVAFVEIASDKFEEKKQHMYEGFLKTEEGLKKFKGVMFPRWPINYGDKTTIVLLRYDSPNLASPSIKEIESK